MAKGKRRLKKIVNAAMCDLLTCTIAINMTKEADSAKICEVQEDILRVYNDYVKRLSHVEPGSTKLFFKKYYEGLNQEIKSITDKISAL